MPLALGFDFPFGSERFDTVYLSANGFLAFDDQDYEPCCDGEPIPLTDHLDGVIALAWSDLNPTLGGEVRTQTLSDPDRFIVTFDEVPWAYGSGRVTAQAILFADGAIELHTASLPAGIVTTQGVEDPSGETAWCDSDRVASANFALVDDAIRVSAP